jgi:oligopeptide/dipeptide ABC transporter ATP-binding protein
MEPLLEVRDLHVDYLCDAAPTAQVLRGVSFAIGKNEAVGILGESGCGKSTLALAILRLLPACARVKGAISYKARELTGLPDREMEKLRGAEVSLIFQDPSRSLHPTLRAGTQIADVAAAHQREWSRRQCRDAAKAILKEVSFEDAERIYASYPHQLSGGQQQRVVFAQALISRPSLLIADEPTSSLDTTMQAEILSLLNHLRQEHSLALVFISHNPAILAEMADRILVVYAGQIVEEGPVNQVLTSPLHPFTHALLQCVPREAPHNGADRRLSTIPGSPLDPAETAEGCPFAPRCAQRMEVCASRMPAEVQPQQGRKVRCFKYGG